MVTSVAVGAAPPGISGRQARQARAQVSDPTRLTIPRNGQARPVAASTRRARARLRASLGRGAQVTVDEQTGGLKAVGRLDGFLTGASGGGARAVALGYVRAHADAFGLTASDLGALRLVRDYRSVDGVRHLQWAQVVDGITVVDSSLLANVTRDGRLINVAGGARGGLRLTTRSPHIGADGAYTRALRSVGSRRPAPARRSARSTGSRRTTYAGRGQAELVAYHAGASSTPRPAASPAARTSSGSPTRSCSTTPPETTRAARRPGGRSARGSSPARPACAATTHGRSETSATRSARG
jgi:hypothetical protein